VPFKPELPTNVYRWDPSGKLDIVVTEDQVPDPHVILSPDYKKLYVISTGKGPGDTGPGGKGLSRGSGSRSPGSMNSPIRWSRPMRAPAMFSSGLRCRSRP
jgi:hypothetical protein